MPRVPCYIIPCISYDIDRSATLPVTDLAMLALLLVTCAIRRTSRYPCMDKVEEVPHPSCCQAVLIDVPYLLPFPVRKFALVMFPLSRLPPLPNNNYPKGGGRPSPSRQRTCYIHVYRSYSRWSTTYLGSLLCGGGWTIRFKGNGTATTFSSDIKSCCPPASTKWSATYCSCPNQRIEPTSRGVNPSRKCCTARFSTRTTRCNPGAKLRTSIICRSFNRPSSFTTHPI